MAGAAGEERAGKRLPDWAPPSAALEAGAARRDITPPAGIYARNWGKAAHDAAAGIHRPLTTTVLALRAGAAAPPLILAALDLGWWRRAEDEWSVRGPLLQALGLEASRVMVSFTHTHAGPSICREDADMPGGHLVAPYLDRVRDELLAAAREALGRCRPATITWTYSRSGLAAHRDLPDPDRRRILCGFHPAGEADDTLLVGRVAADGGGNGGSGRLVATLVNYACHPTTLAWENRLISPDFPGALREVVEEHTGGAPCLYLQGAAGELGPREGYTGEVAIADRNGRQLAFAVLAALESLPPPQTALGFAGAVESGAPLAVWERRPFAPPRELRAELLEVELPLKPMPSAGELRGRLAATGDRVEAERLRRKLRVLALVGEGRTCRMPAWVWRAGDSFLVGHPNEAYSHLQRELRRRHHDHAVAVMNLVNGACGYLAPPDLHGQDIYQVWQSPFDRDALPLLTAACSAAIERLLRG